MFFSFLFSLSLSLSPVLQQLPTLLFVVMLRNFVGCWPESHARPLQGSEESGIGIERELERVSQ